MKMKRKPPNGKKYLPVSTYDKELLPRICKKKKNLLPLNKKKTNNPI